MLDKIAVGDADGLIALALEKDPNHKKALQTVTFFTEKQIDIVFPITVFPEAITCLVRAANQPQKAHLISQQLKSGEFHIEYIDNEVLQKACQIFESSVSKQNTLFDAIVAATAEKLNTKTIFSFDNWYPKLGFRLATKQN